MGIYRKSALLSLLRLRLERDRGEDWQVLQSRDRGWFLTQASHSRWYLLREWLAEFGNTRSGGLSLPVLLINIAGFIAGFALVAGLLEFRSFERINLLWFLVLAVALPFIFWLLSLVIATGRGGFPLLALLEHRAPGWMQNATLFPLLRRTAVVLGQQVSLVFASGMLVAFVLYLLVTDLAFGWSSTLDISAVSLHKLTTILALPWQGLWPEAVPELALVEQSRYFRSAPTVIVAPAELGQWWRFLFMCMIVYVWLPRLVSYAWQRWMLAGMQSNCFESDALIGGWWQRLQSGSVSQQAEAVQQLGQAREITSTVERLPVCPHVVLWGTWQDEHWHPVKEALHVKIPEFQLYKVKDRKWRTTTIESVLQNPADTALIVCKGWEPPTGELADFCRAIESGTSARYLWPLPLAGMVPERVAALNRSWRAFIPTLPESFNLYAGQPDD